MTSVRAATAADLPRAARSLANAFAADPVWNWLTRENARRYERGAAGFFEAESRHVLAGPGEVLVDEECGGAALWCAPDKWKSSPRQLVSIVGPALRLMGSRTPRALMALSALEKAHPTTPHWYLAFLGTDPSHQGKGIGSALIRAVTDRCDEEGMPGYLESSKESNVPFYGRHGFEVTAEHRFAKDGPSLWLMWREPR